MKIKSKLTSRKFWIALAAFVVGVLALFKIDANTVTQISGVIMSLGAVVAYIVGEGLVDSAAAGSSGYSPVPPYTGQATGEVADTSAQDGAQTGAAAAAEVKADTTLPGKTE
jgi:drug/metabolite transporter (DMT)-like permease